MNDFDIRSDRRRIDHRHRTKRGDVYRNSGDFSRGANLINHQVNLWLGGVKWPIYLFLGLAFVLFYVMRYVWMTPFDIRLIFTKWMYDIYMLAGLDPLKPYDLVIEGSNIRRITVGTIAYDPYVIRALGRFWRYLGAAALFSAGGSLIFAYFYSGVAVKRGNEMLKDHHKRGAHLVDASVLRNAILAENEVKMRERASEIWPEKSVSEVMKFGMRTLNKAKYHIPYSIAGIPFPYAYEQTHTMIVGTTGTGKTVIIKNIISQIRKRGQSAVIFDLTGTFIESFYDEKRDYILNPFDRRCPNWSFFNDCENEPEIKAAALALIPDVNEGTDPFWQMAARSLFTEMCIKLISEGRATNQALIDELMKADLKSIHEALTGTIADPLTSPEAARMAESIRAVFNANADVLQCLPDDGEIFSIRNWINDDEKDGSILFVSTTYTQMAMTRALITLWMNTALYSQMDRANDPYLNTWFLIDELGALHKLPGLDAGFQTIRNQGGAIVVGVHSFAKMKETYGEHATNNIINLTRNKVLLAVTDPETAETCSKLIGNREVREVDEAYSISNNTNRDTSTLTANTQIEPLVLPDDLMNLQSLHGYLKMSDGYPTARIELTYQRYPVVAKGQEVRVGFSRADRTRAVNRRPAEDVQEGGGAEVKTNPQNRPRKAQKEAVIGLETERAGEEGQTGLKDPVKPSKLPKAVISGIQNRKRAETNQDTAASTAGKKDETGQQGTPERVDVRALKIPRGKGKADPKLKENVAVAQQARGTTDLNERTQETVRRDTAPSNAAERAAERDGGFDHDM
jgi:type IV conjugative transfer system coupling protein TraD